MICDAAAKWVISYGLDSGVEMGPVISPRSKKRIEGLVKQGVEEGTKILIDGRGVEI